MEITTCKTCGGISIDGECLTCITKSATEDAARFVDTVIPPKATSKIIINKIEKVFITYKR